MATRSSVERILIMVFLLNAFLWRRPSSRLRMGTRIQEVLSPQPGVTSSAMLEGKRGHAPSAPTVVTSTLRPGLVGRRRERELLEKLLESARAGRGAVLVVHGEPGVGKTALLDYVVQKGASFRIARTVGVEGEIELPFAALQQLCAPILALRMGLPSPQRDTLGVAFGLAPGNAPSPFLVGLAVLGLLSEAAEDRPLLCVVDDAQCLHHAAP